MSKLSFFEWYVKWKRNIQLDQWSHCHSCLMIISRAMRIFIQLFWLSFDYFLSCSNSKIFPYQKFHKKRLHTPKNQFPSISRALPEKNSDFPISRIVYHLKEKEVTWWMIQKPWLSDDCLTRFSDPKFFAKFSTQT